MGISFPPTPQLDDELFIPKQTHLKISLKVLRGYTSYIPLHGKHIKRIHIHTLQSKGVTLFCLFEVEAIQTEIMTNGPVEGIVL